MLAGGPVERAVTVHRVNMFRGVSFSEVRLPNSAEIGTTGLVIDTNSLLPETNHQVSALRGERLPLKRSA